LRLTRIRAYFRALSARRIRYRVALPGLLFLLAMLLTGAGAFLSGNNLLFLIFAAMMALLLVSGFLSRLVLAGLELELLLPEHVSARTPTEARVRIRNLKRFTPSFSIELSGQTQKGSIYFPLIPGHSTLEAPLEIVFPRRGKHTANLFLISTGFPFGFIRRTSGVELHRETIVYPSLAGDPDTEALLESLAGAAAGHLRGTGSEFYRIRAYEPTDEARHVDWKGTARTGIVQTREFARDAKPTVELYLDPQIAAGQEQQFETLVEQCAFVAWHLAWAGNPVILNSDNTSITATGENIYDILIWLALVNPVIAPAAGSVHDDSDALHPGSASNFGIVFSVAVNPGVSR
jgi:uncharacterized protein (DUF58 family)